MCICIFLVGLVLIACQKGNLLYNKGVEATVSLILSHTE